MTPLVELPIFLASGSAEKTRAITTKDASGDQIADGVDAQVAARRLQLQRFLQLCHIRHEVFVSWAHFKSSANASSTVSNRNIRSIAHQMYLRARNNDHGQMLAVLFSSSSCAERRDLPRWRAPQVAPPY